MNAFLKPRIIPELWAHQERDIQFYLQNPEVFNTSDPGTGKTRTCIEVIKKLGVPALITAPKSILECAWGQDIRTYSDMDYVIAYAENRKEAFKSGCPIVITNHDAVTWLTENPQYLKQFKGGILINDECTAYKNHKAQRSTAAAAIRRYFDYCSGLTGTPNANGLLDLWHQIYLIDQGKHLGGKFYRFRREVCEPNAESGFKKWVEKPGMADAVASLIADITIRNRREDCLDLPPNQTTWRNFKLSASHRQIYTQMKRRTLVELQEGTINAVNAASLLGKLMQIASGAAYDEAGAYQLVATERYELIADLVEERDHSVVVFNWRHQRQEIERLLTKRKLEYAVIDGSVSAADRELAVRAFQAGHLRALLIHPQSAGHGLTLTRGVATIWCSPTFNAELFEQANARIYRGGQTRSTETILIAAEDTVDEQVYQRLMEKRTDMHHLLEILQ